VIFCTKKQQRHCGLPSEPEGLRQDQYHLAVMNQRSLHDVDRQGAQQRQSNCGLVDLMGSGVFQNAVLIQIAILMLGSLR